MPEKRPHSPPAPPLYTIPMASRPKGYGSLFSKVVFPLVFNLGILGINSAHFVCLLLLLIPVYGRGLYKRAIDWTKDGFGRLLIAITVLCAPTSLTITTDSPPELSGLVERDARGNLVKINLPDRLVIMANHQAYTDWMYLWILACYSGHAEGLTILLKASLKHIPFVGWGMQFFRFIFMHRSWAADRAHLASSLTALAKQAVTPGRRGPLWLLIFPEGTICSDDERAKSIRYAKREGTRDFVGVLHPRSTGLLFALRTLVPSIPDLQLLDVTIGYPGVPFGEYPQEWYGLGSVFWRNVPPPTVRIHLHLYSANEVPSLPRPPYDAAPTPLATPEEAREFELWLRQVWTQKERRLEQMVNDEDDEKSPPSEVVTITQLSPLDWVATFGGGGVATVAVAVRLIRHLL